MGHDMPRERWGSKLGVILAVAGSAIGLGNFLRFPGQAAANGGGAFMIPYLIALVLLGLPLMWIEWTIGRFGGGFGHSTAPGMFQTLWNKNRFIKYFGVIGVFGPTIIFIYYTYVESWLLGYSVFALTGQYSGCDKQSIVGFFSAYTGLVQNEHFSSLSLAYGFFLITFILNIVVVWFGLRGGIERLCKWAMPLLFVLAIILVIRVLFLGTPDATRPENNILNGFGFLWNPDWSMLLEPKVWLAATGQIFFTLSVGIGVILTYASYLTKNDDVAFSGLASAATNEFAEVILGGSIVIPAAFAFFGQADTTQFAKGGTFVLGFFAMPLVLNQMPLGQLFGFLWFVLLFLAGITSSISLAQPAVAFLEDEFNLSKKEAVIIFGVATFILCHLCILGISDGNLTVLDELDFWAVNVCLVVFGLIEIFLFAWVFGMERAWTELHVGSDITIPKFYQYIMKYITPLLLVVLLGWWFSTEGYRKIFFVDGPPNPVQLITRIVLVFIFALLCFLVWATWRRKNGKSVDGAP
jgi:neurotransmitter:Na+ symporter, NSS family